MPIVKAPNNIREAIEGSKIKENKMISNILGLHVLVSSLKAIKEGSGDTFTCKVSSPQL